MTKYLFSEKVIHSATRKEINNFRFHCHARIFFIVKSKARAHNEANWYQSIARINYEHIRETWLTLISFLLLSQQLFRCHRSKTVTFVDTAKKTNISRIERMNYEFEKHWLTVTSPSLRTISEGTKLCRCHRFKTITSSIIQWQSLLPMMISLMFNVWCHRRKSSALLRFSSNY